MNNLFKHNSRSYFDVYNAYVQAYPNKPTWLFEEIAGMFDFQSELMNRVATDIMYPQTRESAYAFAARCGYAPSEAASCTATVTVTLTGAMVKTLSAGYQFGGISTSTGNMVYFELDSDSISSGTDTISCPVTQKKSYTSINIGSITSSDDFSDYPIRGYENVISSSISLVIDGDTWTRVDNFDDSISTDKHFKMIYQSSGKSRVQFGNGTTGLKPTLNEVIYASFAVNDGLSGRLGIGDITINIGGDGDISSLTNAAATVGGTDAESIASILRNAAANSRLRNMVWSQEDLETAATSYSADVVKALGIPGVGTATIHIIEAGGAVPVTPALLTNVDTYVTALTQFGVMPVSVLGPTYVTTAITGTIIVRSGYTAATIEDLVEFAMAIASIANDSEIIDYYDDNGIDACRTSVINSLVGGGWAFSEDENDALEAIIVKWKSVLGSRDYREWGDDLEVGDLWVMGSGLYEYGVDNFILTAPAADVTVGAQEIHHASSWTITS